MSVYCHLLEESFHPQRGVGPASARRKALVARVRRVIARFLPLILMHQLLTDAAERGSDKLAFRWADRARSLTYPQAAP